MRKKVLVALAAVILFIVLICAVFYFTRPAVAFVTSSSFPPGYELPEPGNILKYRMTAPENADLVITAPDAALPDNTNTYLFGREAEEGENPVAVLQIDEGRMWESALSLENSVVLFEESDPYAKEIFSHLSEVRPELDSVTYSGRVSVANLDALKASLANAENVLVLTPISSMELLRSDHDWNAVLDVRDSAAMETTDISYAVSIDWDSTIENLLSGKAELSYTLLTL